MKIQQAKANKMNNQLIEKVIKANNDTCLEFTFTNPVLDQNVARALSRGFVKILGVSKQNSNVNNNLRQSVLENMRKMCQVEPENHLAVDENVTELLTEFYQKHVEEINSKASECTDKLLDAFLIKRIKEVQVDPKYQSSTNPEVMQALLNLNENKCYELSKDILHWNTNNRKSKAVLNDLWMKSISTSDSKMIDNISAKMKNELEIVVLDLCSNILTNPNIDLKQMVSSNNSISSLLNTCANSPECYQICINILNCLFIRTNFDTKVQELISVFVKHVKDNCTECIAYLYPATLSNIVLLLNVEIHELPEETRTYYVEYVINQLKSLHRLSENDFIMSLSHFPQWFDIYFED